MMRNIEKTQKNSNNSGENDTADIENNRKDSVSTVPPTSPAPVSAVDLHCLWYPTIRRTVMCLAKLFKCLDMGVFQSLARELLSMCCQSLETAAQCIATSSRKGGRGKQLDAELFVVKHLLILREQTTPYRQAASHRADATLPMRDFSIDFARLKNSLFEDKSRWFEFSSNNAFLELLFSVPIQVSEQVGDSRRIIDGKLRSRCNQLIAVTADIVVGSLLKFVDKAEDELLKSDFDLKKHPDLLPNKLSDLSKTAFKALSHVWPELQSSYSLYISSTETELILLSPVRKRIAEAFARAIAFAARAYDDDGRSIAALPTIQQVYLVLNKE